MARLIKAIIFDFDGTLAQVNKLHIDSFKSALKRFGVEVKDSDFFHLFGIPSKRIVQIFKDRFNADFDVEMVAKVKHDEYLRVSNRAKLFPDAVDAVKYLRAKGFKLGVGSGSAHDSLMRVLGVLSEEFDAIVDAGTPVPPKPSPELFLKVAEEMDVEPYECAVVEDAFLGVKAAENADMLSIAVTSGYFTKKEVWMAKPAFVIESLSGLKKLFKEYPQGFI